MEDDPLRRPRAGPVAATARSPSVRSRCRCRTSSAPRPSSAASASSPGAARCTRPTHEAAWGLPGARVRTQVLLAGDVLLEIAQYLDPPGKPWPRGLPHQRPGHAQRRLRCAQPCRPHAHLRARRRSRRASQLRAGPPARRGVVYVNDPDGFSVEMLWMRPGMADRDWGFEPRPIESGRRPTRTSVEASVHLAAPLDHVWRVATDHEGMAAWSGFKPVTVTRPARRTQRLWLAAHHARTDRRGRRRSRRLGAAAQLSLSRRSPARRSSSTRASCSSSRARAAPNSPGASASARSCRAPARCCARCCSAMLLDGAARSAQAAVIESADRGTSRDSIRTADISDNNGKYTLWGIAALAVHGQDPLVPDQEGRAVPGGLPSHPRFRTCIVPAVRHFVVPILETPDGRILQDTTDMIEYVEARAAGAADDSADARAAGRGVAARRLRLRGPAAAWRCTTAGRTAREQEKFLCAEFGRPLHGGPDREARFATARQTDAVLQRLPAGPRRHAADHPGHRGRLLRVARCARRRTSCSYPYVLGGRPSIADFGLMAPMFAHLARDPVPATLMKNRAPNVYRWTERMNLASIARRRVPGVPGDLSARRRDPGDARAGAAPGLPGLGRAAARRRCALQRLDRAPIRPCRPARWSRPVANARCIRRSARSSTSGAAARCERGSSPHGLWHFDKAAAHRPRAHGRREGALRCARRTHGRRAASWPSGWRGR